MDRRPLPVPPPAAPTTRVLGEVAWYSEDRGFGFLRPDDGGEDVFVTWSQLPGTGFRRLGHGQRCSFTRDSDAHGPVATDVQVVGGD